MVSDAIGLQVVVYILPLRQMSKWLREEWRHSIGMRTTWRWAIVTSCCEPHDDICCDESSPLGSLILTSSAVSYRTRGNHSLRVLSQLPHIFRPYSPVLNTHSRWDGENLNLVPSARTIILNLPSSQSLARLTFTIYTKWVYHKGRSLVA